ncbi:MAG TPA: HEAT repeat domain-containing protein [Gemmataceae bacterium]|nr:HEAT repeat domain-containing protein [Gemmataceae bacterium]
MKWLGALGLGLLTLVLLSTAAAPADPDPIADLVQALHGKSKASRLKTLTALGNYGTHAKRAIPTVSELLHDKDKDLGNQAARTLAQIGWPAVPALVKALRDGNATVRHRAAWSLSLIGPQARDAVPVLIDALGDANEQVRSLAATALGEIGASAEPACAALIKALGDPSAAVRAQVVQALRRLGAVAVGPLGKALTDEQAAVRQGAAQALALLGAEAKEAVGTLADAVKEAEPEVRVAALAALGAIGPDAKEALPVLVKALEVKHLETQLQAYSAIMLISIDDPDKLAAILRDVTQRMRWATPYLLRQFGPKAQHAVKPLIKLLENRDPNVRLAAAVALGHLEPTAAAEAVPALTKCLKDPVWPVRTSAAVALAAVDENRRDDAMRALGQALAKVEEVYRASQVRLAFLSGGSPFLNPATLTDPVLQAQYDHIVGLFIVAMTMYPCNKQECENLTPIQQSVRETLGKLGPEATPALIRGLNYVARYNIGFV